MMNRSSTRRLAGRGVFAAAVAVAVTAFSGLADTAFAGTNLNTTGLSTRCTTPAGSGQIVQVVQQTDYIFDTAQIAAGSPGPAALLNGQSSSGNDLDPGFAQAAAVAAGCGVSNTSGMIVYGWGVTISKTIGPNPTNTGEIVDDLMSRIILYPGTAGQPNQSVPGVGSSASSSMTGVSPDNPCELGTANPGYSVTVSAASNTISATAIPAGGAQCGANLVVVSCYDQNAGFLTGSLGGTSATGAAGQPITVKFPIPANAAQCFVNVSSQSTPGYTGTLYQGFRSVWSQSWSPRGGFGQGRWDKKSGAPQGTSPALVAPSGVRVTGGGLVSWSADAGAAYYAISRDGQTIAFQDASQLSFQDTPNGAAHTYQVAAQPDWVPAQAAVWSAPVTEPPVNVRFEAGALAWDPVAGHSGLGYKVRIDGVGVGVTTGSSFAVPAWAFTGTPHTATVVTTSVGAIVTDPASAAAISADSMPVTFTLIAAPDNFTGNNSDPTGPQFVMTWNPVQGAASYNLYRDGALIDAGITGTTAQDCFFPFNTSADYSVTAVAANGTESALSPAVTGACEV